MQYLKTWELGYFISTLPKLPRGLSELRSVQAGVPTSHSGSDALRIIKARTKLLSGVDLVNKPGKGSWFRPHTNSVELASDLWDSFTVEAVALAAHEMGHAMQWRKFGAELFARSMARRDLITVEADAWMRGFALIKECGLLQDKHAELAREVAAACWATYHL